MLDKAGC